MTTEEMIAVMQAYVDGKEIQYSVRYSEEWADVVDESLWNWSRCDYRVKPELKEPKYRPYKSTEEMIADFKKRFDIKCPDYCMPLIWIVEKNKPRKRLITGFDNDVVNVEGYIHDIGFSFDTYTYLDGSPFGILEE